MFVSIANYYVYYYQCNYYRLLSVRHPEMIMSFENITVFPNQDIHLNCLALSSGVLMYDWSKRDGHLPQNTTQSCVRKTFFNSFGGEVTLVYDLAIHNVQPSNEGWYCCTATNEGGNTTECQWLEVNS